jgi:hypothetical protein
LTILRAVVFSGGYRTGGPFSVINPVMPIEASIVSMDCEGEPKRIGE